MTISRLGTRTAERWGDVMALLPEHPDLDQARRRAKELLREAQGGNAQALARLAAVSAPLTLSGAQLTLARELGQPSWIALVREIEARNASISEHVILFLRRSVNMQIGAAARMIHENPSLAESGFPAAVVLGDAPRVESELLRDPGAATRVDPEAAGARCTWLVRRAFTSTRHGLRARPRSFVCCSMPALRSTSKAQGGGAGGRLSVPSRVPTRAATMSRSSV